MPLPAATLLLFALAGSPLDVGIEYRLEGKLVKVKDEQGDSEKRFQVALFADAESHNGEQAIYWTLTENGRGQAPWLERFGIAKAFTGGENNPALYYQRDEGLSIAALPALAIRADKPLANGLVWSRGGTVFEVLGESKANGMTCWKVESRDAVGRRREMKVDKATGLIVQMDQRLFLGQGERYGLQWSIRKLGGTGAATACDSVRQLVAARDASGWRRKSESGDLTDKQREQLIKVLTPLLKQAKQSAVESVVNAARRDLLNQEERAESVASMTERAIGKNLVDARLDDSAGKSTAICNGRVTVLHFWQYRDKPLKDPYGQSGYVDFLYRKRDADNVDVYGVHVDSRLNVNATRGASIRSAKKFRAFMNLSYPLLMDGGELLRRVGDPRKAGAKLPLYVVLDPNGKVVAYKSGFYEVDRREGLKALSEAIKAAATVK